MVSAALLGCVGSEPNQEILELAFKLASSGFADTTRIGGGNPQLGQAMAIYNKSAILKSLASYRLSLERLETSILEENWEDLQKQLTHTQEIRPKFLNN